MKGCLAVVGGLVVVGLLLMVGFCGYFVKKGMDIQKELQASFAQLDLTNRDFPFRKPATSRLEPAQLEKVLAMRARVAQGASATLKQFQEMERGENQDFRKIVDQIKEGVETLKRVPIDLEQELRSAKLSFDEYVWTLDTAYGTIFKAADKGNPEAVTVAKAVEDQLVDRRTPGRRAEQNFVMFKNRTMAAVDLDPSTVETVLQHRDALVGDVAALYLDTFLSRRGENLSFQTGK
jgi:hypothetical protein